MLEKISEKSDGDIRSAINILEMLISTHDVSSITIKDFESLLSYQNISSEALETNNYDILSALHKSCRASDVDAALYYCAKALITNDLKSLSRRLICIVNEDIGLANPNLLSLVMIGAEEALKVGMPEARLIYSNLIILICLSDKSNSSLKAIDKAIDLVNSGKNYNPPNWLRDNNYASASKLGHGKGYLYPHDYPNHYVYQQNLPDQIKDEKFFICDDSVTEEKKIVDNYNKRIKKK